VTSQCAHLRIGQSGVDIVGVAACRKLVKLMSSGKPAPRQMRRTSAWTKRIGLRPPVTKADDSIDPKRTFPGFYSLSQSTPRLLRT
jgi:hypothetical protein